MPTHQRAKKKRQEEDLKCLPFFTVFLWTDCCPSAADSSKKQNKTTLVLCFRGEAFLHSQPLWAEGQLYQHQAEEEPPRLRLHRGGRWRAGWVPADQEPCPGWTCSAWWQDGDRWVSWIYWGRRFFHSVWINGFVKGLKGVRGGECAAGLHACCHSACSQILPIKTWTSSIRKDCTSLDSMGDQILFHWLQIGKLHSPPQRTKTTLDSQCDFRSNFPSWYRLQERLLGRGG